jgi:hypothetical protein
MVDSEEQFCTHDEALDSVEKFVERFPEWFTPEVVRFCERHVEGELRLRLHHTPSGGLDAQEWLAIFEHKGNGSGIDGSRTLDVYLQTLIVSCCWKQQAMLVDVVQISEIPEVVITSFVRFGTGDKVYCFLAYTLQGLGRTGLVILGILDDGKAMIPLYGASIGFDELPYDVIHCRPQVMEDIASNDKNLDGYGGENTETVNQFASIQVLFGGHEVGVRLMEGLDRGVETIGVMSGPFDFRPDAN